jgi:hypothetical protein
MPYIQKEFREKFKTILENLEGKIDNCGELNYFITMACLSYINSNGMKYQHINDVMGALDGSSKELYRRWFSKYEDEKIKLNGDIV